MYFSFCNGEADLDATRADRQESPRGTTPTQQGRWSENLTLGGQAWPWGKG